MPPPCSLLVPMSSPSPAVHDQILSKESDHLKQSSAGSGDGGKCGGLLSYESRRLLASSCRSVCPNGQIRFPLDGFSWNLILEKVSKICRVLLKSDKNKGTWHEADRRTFWSYLAQWEMLKTKFIEKIKTHILYSITFFGKSCSLWQCGNLL
jgi:hypothetical protein